MIRVLDWSLMIISRGVSRMRWLEAEEILPSEYVKERVDEYMSKLNDKSSIK